MSRIQRQSFRSCDHPYVPDNIYHDHHGRKRCLRCSQATARRRYEAQGKVSARWHMASPVRAAAAFCGPCVDGQCKGHWDEGPERRCFRVVSAREDAVMCYCGAAWGRGWREHLSAVDQFNLRSVPGE